MGHSTPLPLNYLVRFWLNYSLCIITNDDCVANLLVLFRFHIFWFLWKHTFGKKAIDNWVIDKAWSQYDKCLSNFAGILPAFSGFKKSNSILDEVETLMASSYIDVINYEMLCMFQSITFEYFECYIEKVWSFASHFVKSLFVIIINNL